MPSACNRRRVRLVWYLRARAFLRCVRSISSDIRSSNFLGGHMLSHQNGISAATAVCTWHSVSSGFFPPELPPHPRQEQVAHHAQDQVALQPLVAPALVLIQSDLAFLVFKATLHSPPRGRDQQQHTDRRLRGGVTDEELQLLGVQHVAGDDQVQRRPWQTVLTHGSESEVLALPDHRPLLPVLDPPSHPRLVPQPAPIQHRVDAPRRGTAAGQPRRLAAATALLAKRPRDDPRRLGPAHEVAWHLRHEPLVAARECPEQAGLAAVALVEGQPVEAQAVGDGPVVQLQGDLPLGPVDHLVGDAGRAAAAAVLRPALGRVHLAVEQAVEAVAGVAQVDGDDAVLLLADGAAVLPLHAGGLVPLLDVAGLVEDAYGVRTGVLVADDDLEFVTQQVVVPAVLAEELLQGAGRHAGVEGDRLDALLGDVRELPGDVNGQVGAGVRAREAIVEPLEELSEPRLELADLRDLHARPSVNLGGEHSFAVAGESSRCDLAL